MARKFMTYTVNEEGRDKGKVFKITEMPASKAEAWASQALLALMAKGVELPANLETLSMAAMAEVGIRALSGLKWEVAKPLLDEMFECVQFIPDPSNHKIIRALIEEDIEEVMTRVTLRSEVWKLHTGFLKAVVQ